MPAPQVDCMKQIGASLNAVALQDVFEDRTHLYMIMGASDFFYFVVAYLASLTTRILVSIVAKGISDSYHMSHNDLRTTRLLPVYT